MLKVRVLDIELAVAFDRFRFDVLCISGCTRIVTRQDGGLPRGWAAVNSVRFIVKRLTGFIVDPLGACWLDQDRCVQTHLLVRRWTVVVMGKDDSESTINALYIHDRVSEPALHSTSGTDPLAFTGVIHVAKERVKCRVTKVTGLR